MLEVKRPMLSVLPDIGITETANASIPKITETVQRIDNLFVIPTIIYPNEESTIW